jgi:hypothetical protein
VPTGYTAIIEEKDGVTFEEFLWGCARAFGALIELRDAPLDAPIPEQFVPSGYHAKGLDEAQERLRVLAGMSAAATTSSARADHARAVKAWKESEADRAAKVARYDAVLAKAKAWKPPTPEHEGLRSFMIDQIRISTEHMREKAPRPKALSGAAWMANQIVSAKWDADYHEKALRDERQRVASRNEWVAALRRSVPAPAPLDGKGSEVKP